MVRRTLTPFTALTWLIAAPRLIRAEAPAPEYQLAAALHSNAVQWQPAER